MQGLTGHKTPSYLLTYCKDTPLFAYHEVKVSFQQSSFDGPAQSALATQTCWYIKEMVIFMTFHARATESGSCPWCIWILPTVQVDPAHGASGSCPRCKWILPTVQVDPAHGGCGSCPRCMWILPTVHVDPAHGASGSCPRWMWILPSGSCPACMWILPMVHDEG